MRTLITAIVLLAVAHASAQTREEIALSRAREFHRVMCQSDPAVWKQFILDNYTKALIDRQMKQKVSSESGTTTTVDQGEALESKVKMFSRLNSDFGKGKLVSVKPKGEDVELVATTGDGMTGTFTLKFEKSSPYKIDGLGIEVGG